MIPLGASIGKSGGNEEGLASLKLHIKKVGQAGLETQPAGYEGERARL